MAWYPKANKRPININYTMTKTAKNAVLLHSSASDGLSSLYSFFNNPSTQASSHFHVDFSGNVEQYIDTDHVSWANRDGNSRSVTIETQGSGEGPWTQAQMNAMAKLIRWICATHRIPLRIMENSHTSTSGVGWHRIGIDGNFPSSGLLRGRNARGGGEVWSGFGKTCPGDDRILQVPRLIEMSKKAILEDKERITEANMEYIDELGNSFIISDSIDPEESTLSTGIYPSTEGLPDVEASESLLKSTYPRLGNDGGSEGFHSKRFHLAGDYSGAQKFTIVNSTSFIGANSMERLDEESINDMMSNPKQYMDRCFTQYFSPDMSSQMVYLSDGVTAEFRSFPLDDVMEIYTDRTFTIPQYSKVIGEATPDEDITPNGIISSSLTLSQVDDGGGILTGGSYEVTDSGSMWDNANIIAKWMMSTAFKFNGGKPLTLNQAAGIIGNWGQESKVNPSSVQPSSVMPQLSNAEILSWGNIGGKAVGLAQWDATRRTALVNFASSRGKKWNDMSLQLEFFKHETNGYEGNMLVNSGFTATGQSATYYVRTFEEGFERAGKPMYEARYSFASQFLAQHSAIVMGDALDAETMMTTSMTTDVDQEQGDFSISTMSTDFETVTSESGQTAPVTYNGVLIGSEDHPYLNAYEITGHHRLLKDHTFEMVTNKNAGRPIAFSSYAETIDGGVVNIVDPLSMVELYVDNQGSKYSIMDSNVDDQRNRLVYGVARNGVSVDMITLGSDVSYIYHNGTLYDARDLESFQTVGGVGLMVMTAGFTYAMNNIISTFSTLVTPIPAYYNQASITIDDPSFTAPNGMIEPMREGYDYHTSIYGGEYIPRVFSTTRRMSAFKLNIHGSNVKKVEKQGILGKNIKALLPSTLAVRTPTSNGYAYDFSGYPDMTEDCKPWIVDKYYNTVGESKIDGVSSLTGLPKFNPAEVRYWSDPWVIDSVKADASTLKNLVLPVLPQESPKCVHVNFTLPSMKSMDSTNPLRIAYGARLFGIALPDSVKEASFGIRVSDNFNIREEVIESEKKDYTVVTKEMVGGSISAVLNDMDEDLLAPAPSASLEIARRWYDLISVHKRMDKALYSSYTTEHTEVKAIRHSDGSIIQIPQVPEGVKEIDSMGRYFYCGNVLKVDDKIVVQKLPLSLTKVNDFLNFTFYGLNTERILNTKDTFYHHHYDWAARWKEDSREKVIVPKNAPKLDLGRFDSTEEVVYDTTVTDGSVSSQIRYSILEFNPVFALEEIEAKAMDELEGRGEFRVIPMGSVVVFSNEGLTAKTNNWQAYSFYASSINVTDPSIYSDNGSGYAENAYYNMLSENFDGSRGFTNYAISPVVLKKALMPVYYEEHGYDPDTGEIISTTLVYIWDSEEYWSRRITGTIQTKGLKPSTDTALGGRFYLEHVPQEFQSVGESIGLRPSPHQIEKEQLPYN